MPLIRVKRWRIIDGTELDGKYECKVIRNGKEIVAQKELIIEYGIRSWIGGVKPDSNKDIVTHICHHTVEFVPKDITQQNMECSICSEATKHFEKSYVCNNEVCGVYEMEFPYGTDQTKFHTNGLVIYACRKELMHNILKLKTGTFYKRSAVHGSRKLMTAESSEYTDPSIGEGDLNKFGICHNILGELEFYTFHANPMYLAQELKLLDHLDKEHGAKFEIVDECFTGELLMGFFEPYSEKAHIFKRLTTVLKMTEQEVYDLPTYKEYNHGY